MNHPEFFLDVRAYLETKIPPGGEDPGQNRCVETTRGIDASGRFLNYSCTRKV